MMGMLPSTIVIVILPQVLVNHCSPPSVGILIDMDLA